MRYLLIPLAALLALSVANPDRPHQSLFGSVVLAAITKENGGGNTPGGNANGVPSTNPAGKAPAGQNKKSTGNPN